MKISNALARTAYVVSFLLVALITASGAQAELPKLSLQVSPRDGSLEDTFILSVVIEGTGDAPLPYLTGGDDFLLTLLGPETNIAIINGHMTSRVAYNYRLVPKKEGLLQTPAAEIQVEGTSVKAEPLSIKVSKAAGISNSGGRDYFLSQTASADSVYEGEQLINSLEIYTAIRFLDAQLGDFTSEGFWLETLGENQNFRKRLDNRIFEVTKIRRALYPLRTGTLPLPSRDLKAKVIDRASQDYDSFDPRNDPFFAPFFGATRSKTVTINSNALEVKVSPLPATQESLYAWDPRNPLVGETSIKMDFNPARINVGESKTLKIEVISAGRLTALKTLPLQIGSNIKIYEETPDTRMSEEGGLLISHKVFKFSLVPLANGTIQIPSPKISYFDPRDGKYKLAEGTPISFEVIGEALATPVPTVEEPKVPAASSTVANSVSTGSSPDLEKSSGPEVVSPYQDETWLERLSKQVTLSLSLLILAATLLLIFVLKAILSTTNRRPEFKSAKKTIEESTSIQDLSQNFKSALIKKLEIESDTPSVSLRALTKQKITDPNLEFGIQTLLDQLDSLLYAPGERPKEELSTLKSKASKIISEL